jgi:hypothetical protein
MRLWLKLNIASFLGFSIPGQEESLFLTGLVTQMCHEIIERLLNINWSNSANNV